MHKAKKGQERIKLAWHDCMRLDTKIILPQSYLVL